MRSKLLTTLFSLSVAIAFVSSAHARTIDDDGVTLPADYCWGKPPTIECQGGVCNGTQGADVIVGTPGIDEIHARSGEDYVCGRGGNDTIYGNLGDDRLSGDGGAHAPGPIEISYTQLVCRPY